MSIDSIMDTEFPKGYAVLFGAGGKVTMAPLGEEGLSKPHARSWAVTRRPAGKPTPHDAHDSAHAAARA